MSREGSANVAYDLVASYPVMEFAARVARRGKYSAPIIDEFVIRVVHAAGEVSIAAIGGLLRLSGAQLESFTEPLLRSGLLAVTESGMLTLGVQGRQAMAQAAGEPPRLSRVEEATELCAVDIFDYAFAFKPVDRRTPARFVELAPDEASDRALVRERVRESLLEDYFDHQQYLEIYGLRAASPKQIEYVIDIDEGWGDRIELSLRVLLDDSGLPIVDYPDLRSADQLQRRRTLLGAIEAGLKALKASVPAQSVQFFVELARQAAAELRVDSSSDMIRDREFWIDDGVLVTGRLESRSRETADGFVDKVIAESGLMRGEKERTLRWIVVLIPEPDVFVVGRTYRAFLEGAFARLRRRNASVRAVAISVCPDINRIESTLGPLFQARVSGSVVDPALAGLDGIFIPDELAYLACSDVASSRGEYACPRPRNLVTSRFDVVRDISRRIFSSASFASVKLHGMTDADWHDLSGALTKMTEAKEARVLKLNRKKPGA